MDVRELESVVSSQQKQLSRYETRLKGIYYGILFAMFYVPFPYCIKILSLIPDVVTAYKSLLKEKEALEATVSALSTARTGNSETYKTPIKNNDQSSDTTTNDSLSSAPTSSTSSNSIANATTSSSSSNNNSNNTENIELKSQISTVMNSLATLSAEKSKMEQSFQADKRHLRQDLQQKDKQIKDLQERYKAISIQNALELDKSKSKLIVERHDREKEMNDHMLMVRELQKLLSDERHLKENLEMQLNDLKGQFSLADNSDGRIRELQLEISQLRHKLKDVKHSKNTTNDSGAGENQSASTIVLRQLQHEMMQLKQQHSVAMMTEQRRAQQAEEQYKMLSIVHEDRVANLENRLAELSATVGSYDRLRQLDQENIFKLKEKIAQFEFDDNSTKATAINSSSADNQQSLSPSSNKHNVNELIDEITHLKHVLLVENAKLSQPLDITKLFPISNDHTDCIDSQKKLQLEYDTYRNANDSNHDTIDIQKRHIKTLQDKVQVLNRNIDQQEQELKNKSQEYTNEIRAERTKWKEFVASMESDFRGKLSELELQLQKQRERSLSLLEEKENEIRTLKASFELFSGTSSSHNISTVSLNDGVATTKVTQSTDNQQQNTNQTGDYHMLHYVHELSRKEVEITALRKAKYSAESALRQALQDKVMSQEELHDKIILLEEQVDR